MSHRHKSTLPCLHPPQEPTMMTAPSRGVVDSACPPFPKIFLLDQSKELYVLMISVFVLGWRISID